jgi:hypothetical protein
MTKMVQNAAGVKAGRLPYRPLKVEPEVSWRDEGGRLIVTLIDRRQTEFHVFGISTDFSSCAFRWHKQHGNGEVYDVLCGSENSCSCPGFEFSDGCRHIAATYQLLQLGVLQVAPGSAASDQDEYSDCPF